MSALLEVSRGKAGTVGVWDARGSGWLWDEGLLGSLCCRRTLYWESEAVISH